MKKTIIFLSLSVAILSGFMIPGIYRSWNPNTTGCSNVPTLISARYELTGNSMHLIANYAVDGVSNATNMTVTLPLNASHLIQQKEIIITTNNGGNGYGRIITRPGSNIADLCPSATGGTSGWTATGTKSFQLECTIEVDTFHTRLVFDGNSLMRRGGGVVNQNGVSFGVYNMLLDSGYKLTFQNYAVSGRTTTQLLAEFGTKIKPYTDSNDVAILWEITNDVAAGANAATAYAHVRQWCDSIHSIGAKAIVITGIPRNDQPGYWPVIDSVNNMMRAVAPHSDKLIDVNTIPQLDAAADANNTGYFLSDKIHLNAAGEALIIPKVFVETRNTGLL